MSDHSTRNRELLLPNPFATSLPVVAKPRLPPRPQPRANPPDPVPDEIIRAIEQELRRPQLIEKSPGYADAPHLLEQFRERIERGASATATD